MNKTMQKKYDNLVKELRTLHEATKQAEVKYLLRLRDTSRDHADLIRDLHGDSKRSGFEEFLKTTGLCEPKRYKAFTEGLAKVNDKTALKVGAEVIIALGKAEDSSKIPTVVQLAVDYISERGLFPTRAIANALMIQSLARAKVARAGSKQTTINALKAKIEVLERENRIKGSKIQRLQGQIELLQKQLGYKKKAA